jgi:hypothetical protein
MPTTYDQSILCDTILFYCFALSLLFNPSFMRFIGTKFPNSKVHLSWQSSLPCHCHQVSWTKAYQGYTAQALGTQFACPCLWLVRSLYLFPMRHAAQVGAYFYHNYVNYLSFKFIWWQAIWAALQLCKRFRTVINIFRLNINQLRLS